MNKVVYEHGLSSAKKRVWDEAIKAGNSAWAIWTGLMTDGDDFKRANGDYCEMAVMALTAPTPESYDFPTGSSVKCGGITYVVEPAYIETTYGKNDCCMSPKDLMEALKDPQLAIEYGKAILFWLREAEISMVDVGGLGIARKYQWAIENLLLVLPENAKLADELFAFHPINFLKECFGKDGTKDFQSEYFIQRDGMAKKYVVRAVEALIKVAKLQETGELPMPSWYDGECVSQALRRAITDDTFGAFRIGSISDKEKAKAVFGLIYDFLKGSKVPFYSRDIETIAPKIEDEDERYAFCVRTMRNYPEYNAGLHGSRDEALLSWIFNTATAKGDSRTTEFVKALLAKDEGAQAAEKAKSSEGDTEKERADRKRLKTFEALFVE